MAFHGTRKLLHTEPRPFPHQKDHPLPPSIPHHISLVLPPPPKHAHHISLVLVLIFCILGFAFLLVLYLVSRKYASNLNRSRMRNQPILDDAHEDFVDENQGPVFVHPIWLINTVGLQQAVVDSIAVFKYKKDEGLIEGTECSVCLNEFQEDESLRLLPKCSHAFHIPCIDTWLRSHKNCPLCRAPIVCDATSAQVSTVVTNVIDSGPQEDTRVESVENHEGLGSHQVGEGGTSEMRIGAENLGALPVEDGRIAEILRKNSRSLGVRNSEARVLSDLADHRAKVEEPVRRSISMDASSASVIYHAVANIHPVKHEGCFDAQFEPAKKPISDIVAKRGSRNSSIYRLMKSSSFGRSLQKGPISMKRSFSSSGKRSLPRYSRSQDSGLVTFY